MYKAIAISPPRRDELDDLARIGRLSWASVRRHRGLIVAATVAALAASVLYLALRDDAYTASSRILVDNRVLALTQQDAIYSVSSLTAQHMQSQVEILRSENIARKVIAELDLVKDKDFGQDSSPAAADPAPEATRPLRRALRIFQKRLSVEQVGQSYVVEIRMTASSPERAAQITNSLVAAYLEDQAAANTSVAQSASGWLRSHVSSLGTTARILSAATAPLNRDGPGASIILGFAAFCGLMLGTGLAFFRDLLRRKIRSVEAVQAACGVECFGILPAFKTEGSSWRFWRRRPKAALDKLTGVVVEQAASLDWAMQQPRSLFAHSLRRTRAALVGDPSGPAIILGVTSALPGEGKTVVAANLARVAAGWGKKVLLIDAVPYNSQLTTLLAPRAERGLADALRGAPADHLMLLDRWTNMHFLPGLTSSAQGDPGLISKAAETFLNRIKPHYDLVILDLPPLTTVSDVHELAYLLDKILLVVEFGRCTEDDLAATLANAGPVREKLAGAVLNKADMRELKKYADDGWFAGGAGYADYVNDTPRSYAAPAEPPAPREQPQRPFKERQEASNAHVWNGELNATADGKGGASENV